MIMMITMMIMTILMVRKPNGNVQHLSVSRSHPSFVRPQVVPMMMVLMVTMMMVIIIIMMMMMMMMIPISSGLSPRRESCWETSYFVLLCCLHQEHHQVFFRPWFIIIIIINIMTCSCSWPRCRSDAIPIPNSGAPCSVPSTPNESYRPWVTLMIIVFMAIIMIIIMTNADFPCFMKICWTMIAILIFKSKYLGGAWKTKPSTSKLLAVSNDLFLILGSFSIEKVFISWFIKLCFSPWAWWNGMFLRHTLCVTQSQSKTSL